MDENKNLNNDIENLTDMEDKNTDTTEITTDTAESDNAVEESNNESEKKAKKEKKRNKKEHKPKKLKNQALLKRGGYSIAITAAVLAGIIILNVLVNALSNRFVLEFDMSSQKTNSISEENVDYIKKLDKDVTITVCANAENYVGGYMNYYAQQYGVTQDASDYYKQTIKLIDKYGEYNNKIDVKYIDTQTSEFTEISSKYSNEKLAYGDIIVSSGTDDKERYKIVGFKDIYQLSEDSTYAQYGYTTSNISGNNVETAVTSAIAYVTSDKTKKVALLTGHSSTDYTSSYQTLLKANNYEIETVSDSIIGSIKNDYDAIIIAAPTTDFLGSELDAISEFLDNDGKYGKGLLFFADARSPYLTNLYDFLEQWGITVGEGILFETNSQNYMPDDPTTMGIYSTGKDDITSGMKLCISGYNASLTAAFESENSITVTSLMATPESVVAAPIGTAKDWNGAGDYPKQSYSGAIQAVKKEYNDDNEEIKSYVIAFSSTEFIQSDYNEQPSVSNKNLTLACAERAVGAENTGISFVAKTITNESFSDSVTEASTNIIKVIFMFILPLISIALGIYIFIRRKNS